VKTQNTQNLAKSSFLHPIKPAIKVINDVFDNMEEHLEMLPPTEQPFVLIKTLIKLLVKERSEKEFYKNIAKSRKNNENS
jgi:hypothetical protein